MKFIRSIREKDKDCSRCEKPIGLRSHEPNQIWGFDGKLCHSCFETVKNGIKEYEVTYVGGHSRLPVQVEGFLQLLLFDQINTIVFIVKVKDKNKDASHLIFKSTDIKNCRIVSKSEESLKRKIITAGLLKTSKNRYLQIDFVQHEKPESLLLETGKELDEVSTTLGLMTTGLSNKVESKPVQSEVKQTSATQLKELAPQMASKPCMVCLRNNYSIFLSSENLCVDCFEVRFGKLLLASNSASYYGGHKAFLAGGLIMKEEFGNLYLSENCLIFSKRESDPSKRWQIIVPLKSIDIEGYGIEEKARRQQVSGFGTAFTPSLLGGTGFIHESGKEHHLVVSYKDENGIPQAPRFGVSSFRGKAIREWAAALYEQMVTVRKNMSNAMSERIHLTEKQDSEQLVSTQIKESPLTILKTRLARGEITREEYEELRKALED